MDPTTMTWWLFALTFLVLALTALVALDLRRAWHRTASDLARRLVANAVQEAELERMAGPLPVQRTGSAEPDRPPAGAAGASMPEPSQWTCSPTTGALVRSRKDLLVPPPMVGNDTLRDFMAALVLLTHTGVTRELPATMAARHHDVRNSAGDPITPEIFDAVADTLVGVLRDFDVPVGTLNQLGRVVAPFRMAIAREKVPTAEAKARAAWPTWSDQRGGSVADDGSV
jgi:hypothetical protein